MSLFDSLIVSCPKCGAEVIFQSKAKEMPCMRNYNVSNVPSVILASLNKKYEMCSSCGHKVIIISKTKGWVK